MSVWWNVPTESHPFYLNLETVSTSQEVFMKYVKYEDFKVKLNKKCSDDLIRQHTKAIYEPIETIEHYYNNALNNFKRNTKGLTQSELLAKIKTRQTREYFRCCVILLLVYEHILFGKPIKKYSL